MSPVAGGRKRGRVEHRSISTRGIQESDHERILGFDRERVSGEKLRPLFVNDLLELFSGYRLEAAQKLVQRLNDTWLFRAAENGPKNTRNRTNIS